MRIGVAHVTTREHQRSHGAAWYRLRDAAMRRAGGLCQVCAGFGHATMAREVDHIKPLWAGGPDIGANLQAICKPHHKAKSAHESAQRTRSELAPWLAQPLAR